MGCRISHNTWHDVESWMTLTEPVSAALSLDVNHNLIVDAAAVAPAAKLLASAGTTAVTFTDNFLFNPRQAAAADFAPLATTVTDFPILSFDPNQPDYLKPDFARLKASGAKAPPGVGRYSE